MLKVTKKIITRQVIPFSLFAALSSGAQADVGDYGTWKTLKNLFNPPAANNPVDQPLIDSVTRNDGTQVIDFSSNPSGHKDGFKAGKYGIWQTVTMDGDSTGAKCADGSDYKFNIKRSVSSSNMVIFLEGGGGCWSYESCDISSGGFTNSGLIGGQAGNNFPEGTLLVATQMSLATTALRPGYHAKYDNWTKVYLPYCTQDLGVGAITKTYHAEDGSGERVMHHHGLKVQGAVINWLKDNLEKPGQLLMTGQSAGGFGSELLYHTYRTAMEPSKGYMLNDAGPIMPAPQGADDSIFPSQHAHRTVTEAWDAYDILSWMEEQSEAIGSTFDYEDMGTISEFLSHYWQDDRFVLVAARKDNTISGFSYNRFFDDLYHEPNLENRDHMRDEKRLTDMDNKRAQLDNLPNYGYFAPGYRPLLGGHVLTLPLVESSTTNENDGKEIRDVITNLMSGSGNVIQSWEGDYGLWLDQNGRYNDCLNYFFDITDQDKKSGDVYIPNANTQGNDLANAVELLGDILTGNTCLGG